jgi:hypothetical protein
MIFGRIEHFRVVSRRFDQAYMIDLTRWANCSLEFGNL